MRILQINTSANSGSHGRIAEEIGKLLITKQHDSYIAYGRTANESMSTLLKIGNWFEIFLHLGKTRLIDRHGFGSLRSTKILISKIEEIDPDIIHLHNIHGYYLNIKELFEYLKRCNKPVVWTFHDCWPFTGHCSYFDSVNCYKWRKECNKCPNIKGYPESWIIDNSQDNYSVKRELFTGLRNMVLVSPSEWLAEHLRKSFLSDYDIRVINNGIDLRKFKPVESTSIRKKYQLHTKYIIGVASIWNKRKGLGDFIKLRTILDHGIEIVLVGLSNKQMKSLPEGIKGISRTENIDELAALYSGAEAFVNPTYVDNFPTVNIEALACGTPVITYRTGGSPEAIDENTGWIIEEGDIQGLERAISEINLESENYYIRPCRNYAKKRYSMDDRYSDYLKLYSELI